jgi:hypothetical protein
MALPRGSSLTAIITLFVWGRIASDYTHEGIPVHYILHSKDVPGIPNWWGTIVLPFFTFTYFLLFRISKRLDQPDNKESLKLISLRLLTGLLFTVSISVAILDRIEVSNYIRNLIFILAFIFPLYKSEYFLGWVLGTAFSFGAMIPIIFGSMLCLIYQLVGAVKRAIGPKLK